MTQRSFSRRIFLRTSMAAGAGLTVTVLAACSGGPAAAPTAEPAKPGAAPQTAPAGGAPAKEVKQPTTRRT